MTRAAAAWSALKQTRDRLLAYVFGRDVFISYAREGGLAYARGLAAALKARKVSVYFDQWAAPPGAELPTTLLLALKRAGVMVVVATETALASSYVHDEIAAFEPLLKPILAVDGNCLAKARAEGRCWPALLNGAWKAESRSAVDDGTPSDSVLGAIAEVIGDATQQRRLQRLAMWTAIGFCAVVLAAAGVIGVTSRLASDARKKAAQQTKKAADAAIAEAQSKQRQKVAETKAEAATKQADAATKQAEAAALFAERQTRLGDALSLAHDASVMLSNENPALLPRIGRMAARAMIEAQRLGMPKMQIDQVVRQVLDLMPLVSNPLKGRAVRRVLAMTRSGSAVAVDDGRNLVVTLPQRAAVLQGIDDPSRVRDFTFAAGDAFCAAAVEEPSGKVSIRVWSLPDGALFGSPIAAPPSYLGYALENGGEHVAIRYEHRDPQARFVAVWSTRSGEMEGNPWRDDSLGDKMLFVPFESLVFSDSQGLLHWHWHGHEPVRFGAAKETNVVQFLVTKKRRLLAATSSNGHASIALWSLDGAPKQVWRNDREHLSGIALAPDEARLAAWDQQNVATYALGNGALQQSVSTNNTILAAVSPDGWFLAAAGAEGTTKVIDLDNLLELYRVVYTPPVVAMAVEDYGTFTVATAKSVQRWGDASEPAIRINVDLRDFAFLPGGKEIVVLTRDVSSMLPIYPSDLLAPTRSVPHIDGDVAVAAASRGRIIVGNVSGEVVIHIDHGDLPPLRHRGQPVVALALSRSETFLAVATAKDVYVWSGWGTRHPHSTQLGRARVESLTFGADDETLITGTSDGAVQVWDWRQRRARVTARHGAPVESVSVDRRGTLIASAGGGGRVRLWDAKSGALLHTLEHDSRARRAAVHPDGGYVATIADDTVLRIWRIGAGVPEVVSRVPFDGEVRRVAFSPDGRRIVYGGTLSSTLWQPEDLIAALCARAGC